MKRMERKNTVSDQLAVYFRLALRRVLVASVILVAEK